MRAWQSLPERSDPFVFEHKSSEINYGGQARFHQAVFPVLGEEPGFEMRVFQAVRRFTELLQNAGAAPADASGLSGEWVDIFFDQWGETPRLSAAAFREWRDRELGAVAAAYQRVRGNAVRQEQAAGVPRLGYFVTLATVNLIAALIAEFYEKQIDRLGPLATQARLTLGRCLALALQAAESNPELRRARQEVFGHPEPEEGCLRLLNPFILGFADNADTGLVDETLAGSNFYHLSGRLRLRLLTMLGQVLVKSRKFEARNLKRSLSEPATLRTLLASAAERRRLVSIGRRQPEFREQLVLENALCELRRVLRQCALAAASEELLKFATNNRQLGELLVRPGLRSKLLRQLREQRSDLVQKVKAILDEGGRRCKRSRHAFLGRLSKVEMVEEFQEALGRMSEYLAQTEDFRLLRSHYGPDTNRLLEWQSLKLWRTYELEYDAQAQNEAGRLRLNYIGDRRQADVENTFAEGNLFLCRPEGEIYPLAHQRRTRTTFLFADLRNSTETTMKLTKDTASFLAPYLTAVDTEARGCTGERIYFAGDGYAAYYAKPADAIRAAYLIAARFHKLRLQSSEEHRRKARDILQAVKDRAVDLRRAASIRKALEGLGEGGRAPEVKDLLAELAGLDDKSLTEDNLKKALLKVAAEYAMPRVDVGIAITNGELFFALVGEEAAPKIPIVISPALTQAARLSGSSDLVKKHLEERYSEPFPFNAYVWEQKLYNRGIVVTEELLDDLKHEFEIEPLKVSRPDLAQEELSCYFDTKINKQIILRDLLEAVTLKGIVGACRVYEVVSPFTLLDKQYGNPVVPSSS